MSFIAMLLGTQYKIIRIILFLSFFNYTALINSFGKIDHYLHLSLLISFILIFYTHQPNRIAKLFKSIQLFILSTYTISGIFKFWGIITQSIQGEITVFNPNSLAYNFVREGVAMGEWRTAYVNTHENIADLLTKPLASGEKRMI